MGRAYSCDKCGRLIGYPGGTIEIESHRGIKIYVCIGGNPNYPMDLCRDCARECLEQAKGAITPITPDCD